MHRSDIFDGYGRYDDMSFPHPLLDRDQDIPEDFWDEDPYFEEVYNEISAQECSDFMSEQDARLEQKEVEQIAFEQQPLRHLRKKRYQRMS